jgi:hypothetical protein
MIDGSLLRQICHATKTHLEIVRRRILEMCKSLKIDLDGYEVEKEYEYNRG